MTTTAAVPATREVTGLVRVEERAKGKVWVAAYFRRDGRKVRKTLGMAWVRDSGRRTARGAIVWRAGAGPKPDGYLTPKEAGAALAELLHAEKQRPIRDVPSVARKTVEDVVAAWLTHAKKVSGVSAATYRGYESLGTVMRERLGRRTPVRALRSKDIRHMQSELLDAKLARSTVHHQMTATRAALSLAKENGWIDANPADGVKIVPLPKVEPDFNVLEPSQVELVARAISTVPEDELPRMRNGELWEDLAAKITQTRALWADLVRIAAYTGLRIGELRALQWGDINWKGQVLRVARNLPATAPAGTKPKAPKSGKPRPVPLIPQAIEAFRRIQKLGHPTSPKALVFPSLEDGPFDAGRVRTAFYEGLDAAKLGHLREEPNPMTFHDLRHTFGTMAARVFPLADVQAYLGHSDITTTMRYAHHVPRTDAAMRLATAFAADLDMGSAR